MKEFEKSMLKNVALQDGKIACLTACIIHRPVCFLCESAARVIMIWIMMMKVILFKYFEKFL